MKKQGKHLGIIGLLIVVLLLGMLSGCTNGKTDNSGTDANSQMESQVEEGADSSEDETEESTTSEEQTEQESEKESQNESVKDTEPESETESRPNPETEKESEKETESESQGASGPNGGESSTEAEVPTTDPYVGMSAEEFYADYKPATSLADALYRSKHGFLSGALEVPGQYAQDAQYRPMENGQYLRNTATYYLDDGNTYVIVDGYGNEVMRIYKGGGYITLEEVAAYMYAFGGSSDNLPANYTSKKNAKPTSSIWGEYLRLNHSYFKGSTTKYPYEPELPNISGCGGELQYYEMDIGTTGTVTPGYTGKLYNNGTTITRGAARLVYARQDLNGNGIYEQNEVYVFYTHNHYNDFREYLNYYGGWGEMFGNVTGGGEFDSKTNCNPTPYVPTGYKAFIQQVSKRNLSHYCGRFFCSNSKKWL